MVIVLTIFHGVMFIVLTSFHGVMVIVLTRFHVYNEMKIKSMVLWP
jgi:hypothetical protein